MRDVVWRRYVTLQLLPLNCVHTHYLHVQGGAMDAHSSEITVPARSIAVITTELHDNAHLTHT